jgi:hypothetical protein
MSANIFALSVMMFGSGSKKTSEDKKEITK